MIKKSIITLSLGLTCCLAIADSEVPILKLEKNQREQVSKGIAYMKGKELVNDLLAQGFNLEDFSSTAFIEGFAEAIKKQDSKIKIEDFQVAFNLMKAKLLERELALSKTNKSKSEQWLAKNLKKKEVSATKSGLQYEVVVKGEGKIHPFNTANQKTTEKQRFFIKYLLRSKEGEILEGSPSDKFVGILETPIKGLSEALGLMPVGSRWKLYLKPELAYGSKRVGATVAPGEIVVLEVILGKVEPNSK